jgi:hypothetical protein
MKIVKLFLIYTMGCNCKASRTLENAEKYSEDGKMMFDSNILQKIATPIIQILFGITVGVVFMVMVIPFFIYVTVCISFGKQATFNVTKFKKFFGVINS